MFIVAGLGNPGLQYVNTRHNTGFAALDTLAEQCGIRFTMHKYKGICGQGFIGAEKVLLIKPQTYMNLSGECLQEAVQNIQDRHNQGDCQRHGDDRTCACSHTDNKNRSERSFGQGVENDQMRFQHS